MTLENQKLEAGSWKGNVKARRAFTLVETLVAISILLLALAGPMSIAARALSSAYYARDEVGAYYLAQEGIEYVRAVRDQNFLTSSPWLAGLDSSAGSDKDCITFSCMVDVPNFSHSVCSGVCSKLLVTSSGGLYNKASGAESPYTRVLTIEPVSANEVAVKVTVSWMSGRIPRTFQLVDHLFRSQ